ncbi:MAG: hypothetical protein LBC88_08290 [Spirochaetaceae bacterium]|nr:hypothetical protein [Spirochaetaceae bacterium]
MRERRPALRAAGRFTAGAALCFALAAPLAARGRVEEPAAGEIRNGEWRFAVTAFDTAALPPSRRVTGDRLMNSLVHALTRVERHIRPAPEYTWYENAVRETDRSEAAKKLAVRHEERSRLLFQGHGEWRYTRDLRVMDRDIAALEAAYHAAVEARPVVENAPVLRIEGADAQGVFPVPPGDGRETEFCVGRNADAFMTGAVSEYYGRVLVTVRVYARYARAWIYEDTTIFSPEDLVPAMEELVSRLAGAIQGAPPAAVRVVTEPEGAMLLLKGRYAGRSLGASARAENRAGIIEAAPGRAEISVRADDHYTRTFSVDLESGVLSDITVTLTPLGRTLLMVRDVGEPASVYRGALYLGRTPLLTEIPSGSAAYIHLAGPDGASAATIIPANLGEGNYGISLRLRPPLPEGRTERARRQFYGAWARFWIAMPLSVLINGFAISLIDAYNANPAGTEEQLNEAQRWYWATVASDVLVLLFLGESIGRAVYYARVSSRLVPALERDF